MCQTLKNLNTATLMLMKLSKWSCGQSTYLPFTEAQLASQSVRLSIKETVSLSFQYCQSVSQSTYQPFTETQLVSQQVRLSVKQTVSQFIIQYCQSVSQSTYQPFTEAELASQSDYEIVNDRQSVSQLSLTHSVSLSVQYCLSVRQSVSSRAGTHCQPVNLFCYTPVNESVRCSVTQSFINVGQ